MKLFDFPYHRVGDEYPESSTLVQFGGGYTFASKPRAPDQISFKLNFAGMWFYAKPGTPDPKTPKIVPPPVLDLEKNPPINMGRLQAFYEEHRLYEKFQYAHPRRGLLVCRFKKPLSIPDGIVGANGQVQEFTVEFQLQP